MTLESRVAEKSARIAVIGCGYVGLPLSVAFAAAGYRVTCLDTDAGKIASLQQGRSYVGDVADDVLAPLVSALRLEATTDFEALRLADVIFVSVPTPFDRARQPDLRYVVAAAEDVAKRLRPGQLIILESTTYPGTTDEVMRPILERGGLRAGADFHLAFSPERIDPGNRRFGIANTPKVVGGVDTESGRLAALVLQQVITQERVHVVSSARAAEFTKLLENTFRAVNIALVNELAMLCDRMDLDVWEIIGAAATKPYGFMPFYPGPGVGGHCIPVDPYYLSWKAREFDFSTKFIELAAETNLAMQPFTVERIRRLLNAAGIPLKGARVLALGAAFKPDISDARNSPAIRVMEILHHEGALVSYHDPHVPALTLASELYGSGGAAVKLSSVSLDARTIEAADCVVLLVAHSGVDYGLVLDHGARVLDAVNVTRGRSGRGVVERL